MAEKNSPEEINQEEVQAHPEEEVPAKKDQQLGKQMTLGQRQNPDLRPIFRGRQMLPMLQPMSLRLRRNNL